MECPSCKAEIPEGSRFCIECGASLPLACPSCGRRNPPRARFCANCGHTLAVRASPAPAEGAADAPPPAPVPPMSAERRQVTVMFCDLVGSTALSSRLDPEDLHGIISAYHRSAADTVGRFDGFVAKYMGDGVLVYFGYPQAHEDDAERAVRAGLALVDAVGGLPTPERLHVRVGIATGLVVVGDLIGAGEVQERGIVGETPNLAARLQSLAEPDAVVIGPRTRQLLGDIFEYRDLGAVEVKGFAAPLHPYQVLRVSVIESRFEALHAAVLTPLVGRDEEIDLLLRRWQRAKSGSGEVVLISGEPGIGKSRLTATVLERLAEEPYTRLRYFCSPRHTDSALYPIISQLEHAAGFERDDDASSKLDKLDALLARAAATIEDRRLIADLLALPDIGRYPPLELTPPQRKQRTRQALLRQLEGLARNQPVLQIFEDAHWIDPTSLETMDQVIDLIRRLPVLLVMTFRPEFSLPWVGQPHVTMIALSRLDQRDGAELIGRIVGNQPLPQDLMSEIVERTDGVPLFIEELTKAVLEAGGDGREAVRTVSGTASRDVPASLHASLMARFDRLGMAKEVAQVGSAIGREFSYELLSAVSSVPEAELQAALNRLTGSGLLYGRGTPPEASYLFKHALVQDVAYGTLLHRTRQHLHARIAAALEQRFPDRVVREPEVVAHHFTEAHRPERATDYWFKAGKQAAERSANLEAIRHFSKALTCLRELPETVERDRQELAIQVAIGTPLIAVHGYAAPETGAAYARARALCEQLGDTDALLPILSGQYAFHFVRGDHGEMRQLADEARRVSKPMAAQALGLTEFRIMAQNAMYFGSFVEARSDWETILRRYDPGRHRPPPMHFVHDPKFYALSYLAVINWILGHPDQARRWSAAAMEYAAELNQATLTTHANIYGGAGLEELLRDPAAVRARADVIVDLADQHNLYYFRLGGLILKGWAMARQGAAEEGLALMRRSATERLALGVGWYQVRYLCMLAESYLEVGAAEEGLAVLDDAKALAMRNDEHMWEAELERTEGELRRALGASPAEVEAHYQAALSVARRQSAKSFELRAAMSLARLRRDQGRGAEARGLLAPIYGWFTEGLDTRDLKEAKVLLEAL